MKILNIKELELTCKACGTRIYSPLNKSVIMCPACQNVFYDSFDEAPFKELEYLFKKLSENKKVNFKLICEEQG